MANSTMSQGFRSPGVSTGTFLASECTSSATGGFEVVDMGCVGGESDDEEEEDGEESGDEGAEEDEDGK